MRAIILTLLLILSAPLAASQPVVAYTSEPGETLDTFVLRIAPNALVVSMSIPVSGEICGEFRNSDGGYVIEMYTIRHPTACSYDRKRDHDYTGLTFHTHVWFGGKPTSPRFSQEDYDHPGYMAQGNVVMFQNGRGTARRVRR